jgi:hypothetical protein
MTAFRRHLRLWAAAWIVFQATSLSALVPLNACAARLLPATTEQEPSCHTKAVPAPCPMRAANGVPCPMHRGTVHDADQTSRDACSMRGTCDPPVAALFALLSNHGVLTPSSETLPDLSRGMVSPHADVNPVSLFASPDSPPPRA